MSGAFPKGFLWGASTSAYQAEGAALEDGKKPSQQDIINQDSYKQFGFATAEIASDQYHHYKEDVALMKEMGFTAYRFSIAWSRVFPDGVGEVNQKGIQYYRDLIDELIANGIEPISPSITTIFRGPWCRSTAAGWTGRWWRTLRTKPGTSSPNSRTRSGTGPPSTSRALLSNTGPRSVTFPWNSRNSTSSAIKSTTT